MKKIGAILFIGLFIVGGYTGYRIMQIHIRVKKPMHKFL